MKQVNIKVAGLVQGVFFRAETQDFAEAHSITGWVKNDPDGGVSILAQGEQEALNQLIEWCRKGPSGAEIKDIRVSPQENIEQILESFEVIY